MTNECLELWAKITLQETKYLFFYEKNNENEYICA